MKSIGYLYLILAGVLWGIFGIFTKLLIPVLGVYEQLFLRSAITVLLLLMFLRKRYFKKISTIPLTIFLFNYLFATITFSYAIIESNITITVFCFYIGNVLSSIALGRLLLKEHISTYKIIAILILLIGILIFFHNFTDYLEYKLGIFLGTICGISSTLIALIRKQLPSNTSDIYLTFIQAAFALIATSFVINPAFITTVINLNAHYIFLVFIYGVLNVCIQFFALKGFNTVDLNTGTVILTIEIVSACVFSWLIFNEAANIYQLIGCFLIFASIVCLSLEGIRGNSRTPKTA